MKKWILIGLFLMILFLISPVRGMVLDDKERELFISNAQREITKTPEREEFESYTDTYSGKVEKILTRPDILERDGYLTPDGKIPLIITYKTKNFLGKIGKRLEILDRPKGKFSPAMDQKEETIGVMDLGNQNVINKISSTKDIKIKRNLGIINAISADVPLTMIDDLVKMNEIERIDLDRRYHVLLNYSIGLINGSKVWELLDGQGNNITGKNITIAIIDTGIDYTHDDLGDCSSTEFLNGNCSKVMDGYDFVNDDDNPMDDNGHGTHVASTAAGNGTLKGIAPDAGLVAYKVCDSSGSCPTSDIIAAIERSTDPNQDNDTSDHYDIMSMSLGGSGNPDDSLSLAVDNAVDLGVVAVIAAGNSGPNYDTVDSPGTSRKAITVGASYNDILRNAQLFVNGTDEISANGLSHSKLTTGWLNGTLLNASLGYSSNFTSQNFTDKIALIQRGIITFREKVQNAYNADAIGTIIYNDVSDNFNGTLINTSMIPVVSISKSDGEYLLNLLETGNVTVNMSVTRKTPNVVASFSSRGLTSIGTVKPDVLAPGVEICAAQWNSAWSDKECGAGYTSISGTSMATPHISGAVALIKQAHPSWSPIEIKMALRNTAIDIGYDYRTQGYGRIDVFAVVELNKTPCIAEINTYNMTGEIFGTINISGTATCEDFKNFTLEIGSGYEPSDWELLNTSTEQVNNTLLLYNWSSLIKNDGSYTFKLRVFDYNNTVSEDRWIPTIKNTRINSPGSDQFLSEEIINITGTAIAENFGNYTIEYGEGSSPSSWSTTGITLMNGGTIPVENGTLGTLNASQITPSDYDNLRLITYNSSGSMIGNDTVTFFIDLTLQKGFPVNVYPSCSGFCLAFTASPTIADLNNDGKVEILTAYQTDVSVFTYNGSYLTGWPVNITTGGIMQISPAAADLNGDENKEIIVVDNSGELHVFYNNGSYYPGFPKSVAGYLTAPVVGDVDMDGNLEIAVGDWGGDVHVIETDSSYLNGWPQDTSCNTVKPPAIGDVDGDGNNELVVSCEGDYNRVYVYEADGSVMNGWPKIFNISAVNDYLYSPSLTDIDNDGDLEIFVSRYLYDQNGTIYGWHHDGSNITGWPVKTYSAPRSIPAIGDVDGDNIPEIVVGTNTYSNPSKIPGDIYVFYANGSVVSGFPVTESYMQHSYYGYGSPAIGDIDGDGLGEIIADNDNPYLYAYNGNGSSVPGFPKFSNGYGAFSTNTPFITDLDSDGDVEVGYVNMDYNLFVWDLDESYNSTNVHWGTFCHDSWHSGLYGDQKIGSGQPTTTTTTTTIPSSSGSGGSTSLSLTFTKSQAWSTMSSERTEIMLVNNPDIGIKQISIDVENPINNVRITVTKLEEKPVTVVHEVSGKVYKYIEIEARNIEDENILEAKIQFPVNKSWIIKDNIDRASVALNRYHDNRWNKLPTREIDEDNDYIYFETESPGFTTFAVTGDEIVVTATSITTTTVTTTTTFITPTKKSETSETVEMFSANTIIALMLIILLVIIFVVVSILKFPLNSRRRWKKI